MNQRLEAAIHEFDLDSFIREHFSEVEEAAKGSELRINCFSPHGCNGSDRSKKLYINPEKRKWNCFKCGYGDGKLQPGTGSLIRLIADVENLHPSVVRQRLIETVIPLPDGDFEDLLFQAFFPAKKKQEETDELEEIDVPKCFRRLSDLPRPDYIRYEEFLHRRLHERKFFFTDQMIPMACYPKANTKDLARWEHRLIFPITDIEGKIRSFVGRDLPKVSPSKQKWINWEKNLHKLLYPIERLKSLAGVTTVLTEGIFDFLGAVSPGFFPVCTFGKKLSDTQILLLKQLKVKRLVLAWDYDAKPQMMKTVDRLRNQFDTYVFPFIDPIWKIKDLGDVNTDVNMQKILENEYNNLIHVDSNEFITWSF